MPHSPAYTAYQKIEDDVTLLELRTVIPVVDSNGEPVIPSTVDEDRIDRIIEDVSDIIDGVIGSRYIVPLTDSTSIKSIEWICRAMVISEIYREESGGPEWRQKRYGMAMETLQDMADGKKNIASATETDNYIPEVVNPFESDSRGSYTDLLNDMNLFDETVGYNSDSEFLGR